jgi:hypothetical protein
MIKTFTQHLVLWLHLLFVVFTIGPVTIAISSTPRYIRQRDVKVVRYLSRTTFIFALASLGVLVAGEALASMIKVHGSSLAGQPWVIISATLFIVALALLALIIRDQRRAIKALDGAALLASTASAGSASTSAVVPATTPADTPSASTAPSDPTPPGTAPAEGTPAEGTPAEGTPADTASAQPTTGTPTPAGAEPRQLANVEQSRIAMMGGLVGLIWLVILVLMVWH